MNPFIEFRENILKHGLEYYGMYYAKYEGNVADNDDPEVRGRIKVKCPAAYGKKVFNNWALPYGMFTGNKIGFFAIPQVGDPVWVSFKNGMPEYPLWTYGWIPKDYKQDGAGVGKYLITTPNGYRLLFDDKAEKIELRFSDTVTITANKDNILMKYGENNIEISDKISINFGDKNLKTIMDSWLDLLIQAIITTPSGPGYFAPNTITELNKVKTDLNLLMK